MKYFKIIGDNYCGQISGARVGCRAIVVENGKLLLSFETKTGQYMLPGGGLESGETEIACVKREIAEETGYIIKPDDCALVIDEFYGDKRFENRYFFGKIVGETTAKPTDEEIKLGLKPVWLTIEEAIGVFSNYGLYVGRDEMRRGMYMREYTALKTLLSGDVTDILTVKKQK